MWRLPWPFVPPTKSLPLPAVLIKAPGANCSGYVMSPPGFGRLSSARALSVVEVFGFSGLTRGASPVTVTSPFAEASFSMKLTVCLCPRPEETDSLICDSKPSTSALTEYEPGCNCGKLKRPAASVFTLRFDPVSVPMIVTVAPAMAAPLGSTTVPTMALVVSPWAIRDSERWPKNTRQVSKERTRNHIAILGTPNLNARQWSPQSESIGCTKQRTDLRSRLVPAKSFPLAASESVDDYLKAILELGGVEDARVTTNALAERLGVRNPSVTGMLQKLAAQR